MSQTSQNTAVSTSDINRTLLAQDMVRLGTEKMKDANGSLLLFMLSSLVSVGFAHGCDDYRKHQLDGSLGHQICLFTALSFGLISIISLSSAFMKGFNGRDLIDKGNIALWKLSEEKSTHTEPAYHHSLRRT